MRTQYERWIDPATGELHETVETYEAGGPKPPTLGRAYLIIAVLEGALTVEEAWDAVHWTQYERWIDVATGEVHESATVFVGEAPIPPTLGRAYQLVAVIQGIHSLSSARVHAETSTARQVTRVELWDAERDEALPIPGIEPAEYDLWPYVADDQFRERLGEPTQLTLTLHAGCAPVVADPVYLARRRVLRVIYDDGSHEEYRISKFERELSGETDPQVTAESLWTMLDTRIARRVLAGSGMVDVSFTILRRPAQQLLELILADAPSPYLAGSAGEYAAREGSIRAHAASHLALLRQLCQDLGCEWEEVWDEGAGAYRINLVREVGGKGVRPIEQGSGTLGNRRTLRRSQDGADLFTRVVPLAGPDDELITIAQATWPVIGATYSAGANQTTLRLGRDPIWVDGMPFGAGEAGEFGAGGSWHAVVSTATPDTIVVTGDARALTAGRFRLEGGTDLTYLADPAAEAETSIVERPLVRSDIPPAANLLQEAGVTADMTEWAGGLPVGVEKIGNPVVTQTTDERSARVGGVAAEIHADAGEGIRTIQIQVSPTSRSPYFSATAALRVLSGGVRLEVIGSDGKSYPLGDAATSSEDLLRALLIGGVRPPAGGTRLMITALKAGTVFTLDAWTLTQSATPYEYAPEMGPQALWHAGGRMLAVDGGLTPDALDGAVFDVAHFDGETADEIRTGSRVQVIDSGLDLESRVVELSRGYRGGPGYRKTVTISRRRKDLVDYLKDDEAPDRRLGEGGETRPAPAVAIQGVRVDEAGRVVVSAGGGDVVSRILITAAVGGAPPVPTPQLHHGVIADAVGTVQTTISAEAGDVVRVMARGESADGVLGIVAEAEYQVPSEPAVERYARCLVSLVETYPDRLVFEVTADPDHGTVYLYELTGAALGTGSPGKGAPMPSGTRWTILRPAPEAAQGMATWRAEAPGYVGDDQPMAISQIGQDTVALVVRARILSSTDTEVKVRVAVADPVPAGGSGPVAVLFEEHGTGGVAYDTPGSIDAPKLRADIDDAEAAGAYVDLTITRGIEGAPPGRVVVKAGRVGRVRGLDSIDVPAPGEPAVLYAECQARVTASSATEITVTVDAVPPTAQVELLAGSTAERAASGGGPAPGVKSPTGTVWKLKRPAALTSPTEARFRATLAGYESDDDHVLIPEQGRDTVSLLMRARVLSATATQTTVRVAVADPIDPTRTGAITVTPAQGGAIGALSPGAAQTIAAASVTANIDTTGYIDFVIGRGAAGSGGGRVIFTATRSGRVADSDAVDVPELPPNIPAQSFEPRINTTFVRHVGDQWWELITATDWQGGVAGLEFRYVYYRDGTAHPGWPGFLPLGAGGAEVQIGLDGRWPTHLDIQARDAAGRIANKSVLLPAHDLTTFYDVEFEVAGGVDYAIDTAKADATTKAATARSSAVTDSTGIMEGRGLHGDGYEGLLGRGAGGLSALTTVAQVREPSQNLCGPGAGAEVTITGGGTIKQEIVTLAEAGLSPGDHVSLGVDVIRPTSGTHRTRILIQFRDAAHNVIDQVLRYVTGTTWERHIDADMEIPAGTYDILYQVFDWDGVGAVTARRMQINRGAVALGFEQPPLRAGRGDEGRAFHSFKAKGVLNKAAMDSGNIAHVLITAGLTVQARNYKQLSDRVVFSDYGPAFDDPPAIHFGGGGLTVVPTGNAAGQLNPPYGPVVRIREMNAAGFSITAQLEEVVGTVNQKSATQKRAGSAGPSTEINKTDSSGAWNEGYTFTYDVTLPPRGGAITVEFWIHNGTNWALVDTSYSSNGGDTIMVLQGLKKTVFHSGLQDRTGWIFGFGYRDEAGVGAPEAVVQSVSWEQATPPRFVDMTPDGAPGVHCLIVGK